MKTLFSHSPFLFYERCLPVLYNDDIDIFYISISSLIISISVKEVFVIRYV